MAKSIHSAIKNREVWPDKALYQLLAQIDQEFEWRSKASQTEDSKPRKESEDLQALEQALLGEARRYLRERHVIRG
ncbi:hypothetical protein [Aquisalimonas sp.]|uniref:hypothetical protein n=1 Tax=Aquisalimonas sp. TaxID=1872621 RepID=UPI0025BCA7C2|nr:hypothetical protein [Aquisalimonas sp.]